MFYSSWLSDLFQNKCQDVRGSHVRRLDAMQNALYLIFWIYMKEFVITVHGRPENKEFLCMALLFVSPISQHKSKESDESFGDSEATEITAGAHVCQFESIFRMLDLDLHDCLKCTIADNCSVIIVLSKALKVPHAG